MDPTDILERWTEEQLILYVERRNRLVKLQNGSGEEESDSGRASLSMERLQAASQERFTVWKQMQGKRA